MVSGWAAAAFRQWSTPGQYCLIPDRIDFYTDREPIAILARQAGAPGATRQRRVATNRAVRSSRPKPTEKPTFFMAGATAMAKVGRAFFARTARLMYLISQGRGTEPPAVPQDYSELEEPNMSLRINSEAPNFTAETTQGKISFHDWIGNGWAILFSHPKDFTPVCTTELGYMAGLKPQFDKRNTKILGLSVDPVGNHTKWAKDIEETQGHAVTYPMVGDPELTVAKLYDMLPEDAGTTSEGRTPADNATVRSVFIIGPDKKIKAMLTYPMSTGRNFDEVLRLLDSCQLTAKHAVATPVNWKPGQDVIIPPAVTDEQAKQKFPGGWKTLKPYLRVVAQPRD